MAEGNVTYTPASQGQAGAVPTNTVIATHTRHTDGAQMQDVFAVGGEISTESGSTTPLAAGQAYTGQWEDVSAYSSIVVAAKTDKDGTYSIDFSPDGVNVDSSLTRYYRTAYINPPHRFTVTRQYARISFTNSSTDDQTYFRLEVMLGNYTALNAPLDTTLSPDYDSIPVRPTDFRYESALGRRQGTTTWNKFGYNADVDTGTEMVWSAGGTFTRIDSASTFTVVSSSSDDVATVGAGAWNIVIYYVDANRRAQTGVVALNGTSSVVSAFTGLGINRIAVYNSGAQDSNVGNITVTATTGGSVQAHMPAGEGTSQQALFFTQSDHNFLLDFLLINVNKTAAGASPRVTIKGWVYSYVSTAKYLVFTDTIDTAVDNHLTVNFTQPFIIGEKSILYFEATTDTNNTTVSLRMSGIEFKDVDA